MTPFSLHSSKWSVIYRLYGSILHVRQHVRVGIERDACLGVPQPLADRLDRRAGLQHQHRVRVSEIVEPNAGHTGSLVDLYGVAEEVVGVQQQPVRRRRSGCAFTL